MSQRVCVGCEYNQHAGRTHTHTVRVQATTISGETLPLIVFGTCSVVTRVWIEPCAVCLACDGYRQLGAWSKAVLGRWFLSVGL
jgi:hypothetical protein